MSCQQAARLITTNSSTRIREDPYVFTETVPTTPPILFNIQKSRAKLPESITTATKVSTQKLPLAQLNGQFAATATTKAQASLSNVVSIATIATSASAQATTTTSFTNVLQSHQQQQNKKQITTNVCVVRPQQQIQQQPQQHYFTSLPTPSLWQTPLLLDTVVSPPTSPASLPSPTPASPTPVASANLPPSNFHHTTFAQHLQKVGCIRKPPTPHSPKERPPNSSDSSKKPAASISDATTTPPSFFKQNVLIEAKPNLQHSVNDLNEIPVNVIYRKPQSAVGIGCSLNVAAAANSPSAKVKPQAAVSAQKQQCENQTATSTSTPEKDKVFAETHANPGNLLLASKPTSSIAENKQKTECCSTFSDIGKAETKTAKCLQTDTVAIFSTPPPKTQKRKIGAAAPTEKLATRSSTEHKKCRRASNVALAGRQQTTHAFAVVTCPERGYLSVADADLRLPPYCLQQHWLGVYDLKAIGGASGISALSQNIGREERIAQHKNELRRQAMQLLAAEKLLQCPLQAARRRLICVDRLLHKYADHSEDDFTAKSCILTHCSNQALPMTNHCYQHIGCNAKQHLFLSCTAKFSDNSQCRIPVFDIVHDMPLCTEHARKRDAYNRIWHEQRPRKMSANIAATATAAVVDSVSYDEEFRRQQQLMQDTKTYIFNNNHNNNVTGTKPIRNNKRKSSAAVKPVGRPQKRFKKLNATTTLTTTPTPLCSVVKQRKSSNTSLESIASNSHSSHSQPPFATSATANVVLAPPALAPLSGGGRHIMHVRGGTTSNTTTTGFNRMLNFGSGLSNVANHEINQIVAQFAMVANNNSCNSHSDFSSGLSSLLSADEILKQDMLSICENSSAYASSEDTGVGGLSETELMVGAHDAEEIPLGDTRLLEEHDLANVLNTLPVDAFNELFTAVRQDERDEVERALELADKHLKSLQQTIGTDSDFLGDFLDVNDHMLDDSDDICSKMEIVSSVLHSPDTSGIDTATLFAESGSNSGGGVGCTTLVQT